MQLRDPTLLINIVGIPANQLDRVLKQEVNAYTQAISKHGLACIKQYWQAHCSTLPRLPAIALLDQNSCPRGISDRDFVALLTRLTDWQKWQIWDLWSTFNAHNCGFVGCQEFTLLVVLLCAALSHQQLQAVHAFSSSIYNVFAGVKTANAMAGLLQCCQLLGLPNVCLDAAVKELQVDLLQLDARHSFQEQHSRQMCNTCKACSGTCCKQSSSNCCPCSSCSCRHLGGVQTSWQDSANGSNSKRACFCSSKSAVVTSGSSTSGYSRSCSLSHDGSSSKAGPVVGAGVDAACTCTPSSWQGISEQDVQLVLFCTIHLTYDPVYFLTSTAPPANPSAERKQDSLEWCCISCMKVNV